MIGPSSPLAKISRALSSAGWKRWLKPTFTVTPLCWTAAISGSSSSGRRPPGFSIITCLPARTASRAVCANASWVTEMTTASTSLREQAWAATATTSAPGYFAASCWARAGFRSVTATTLSSGSSAARRLAPINPQPTRATRMSSVSPILAAVLGQNAAQRVNVVVFDFLAMAFKARPRIPGRGKQLAAEAVAVGRAQPDAKLRGFLRRRRLAGFHHRLDAVEEGLAHHAGAGIEQLVGHAGVEQAVRDGVDVDVMRPHLFRQRVGEAHHRRLGRGIGADPGQGIGGAAAGKIDDLAIAGLF